MEIGQEIIALTQAIEQKIEAPRPGQYQNRAQIRDAAEQFEAVYLSEMLGPMFESLDAEGPFGGGSGERMFRSVLVQEYSLAIAKSGGVGIADAVERELLKMQEVNQ